jgi:hypothetical protein
MAARRIRIQAEGAPEDHGHLRFAEFIRQLDLLRNALKQTERLLTGGEPGATVYWRVIDLSHDSPVTIVLEEVVVTKAAKPAKRTDVPTRKRAPVIEQFLSTIREIRTNATVPDARRDLPMLEAYRELASIAEQHVSTFTIEAQRKKVRIDERFRRNIDQIIGPDELLEGSISGVLEAINVHNTLRFNIYPIVGPKKVTGSFSPSLKADVIRAITRHVRVQGTLRYKSWAPFPHAIDAESIEILPEDDDLPTLAQLRGIAPHATGDLPSEAFVQAIRDDSW